MQYMLGCKASALAREDSASFLLEQDWTARPCLHFPRVRRRWRTQTPTKQKPSESTLTLTLYI